MNLDKWISPELLCNLIKLLKIAFKKNNRAKEHKENGNYFAKIRCYDEKSRLLEKCLNLSKIINHPRFSFGFTRDDNVDSFDPFHYIYYFQIGKFQISFHSPYLYDGIPKFKKKWIGVKNESFPFDLRKIKSLILIK